MAVVLCPHIGSTDVNECMCTMESHLGGEG
jgi:hypothetical protein